MEAMVLRGVRWTRRAVLGSLWGATLSAARVVPNERKRYLDPATEFEIQLMTDPAHNSFLPRTYNTVFTKRSDALLYASDRDGPVQAYTMDLKSGESRQLTEASNLDVASLTLTPDYRSVC